MKKIFLVSVLILFCAVTASGTAYAEDVTTKIPLKVISKSEDELRLSMRALWESRAILLRAYIVSTMNDSEDADEVRDKLLKNAGDLGGSIKPYYGGLASGMLTGFLKKDVGLTGKVIKAAKAGNKEALDLTKKAKTEALDLTGRAEEEALNLTKKATEEALGLTKKAKEEAPGLMGKVTEEATDLTGKANEEALNLTEKAKEEALDLTKKAKEEALSLTEKNNEEPLDLTKKAKGKALDLTEKAKGKALDLTEKAKNKAFVLTEKGSRKTPDIVNKDRNTAMDLIKRAKEIAIDLIKKAEEIAMDLTEKAKERALVRAKKAREEALDLAKKRWYGNARDLAGFFAIPHNQTKKDLTDMLRKHLDLTWGEIEAMLVKDAAKELDYYEKDKTHMVMFSDVLVDGLIKQFPNRFKE